MRRAGGWEGQEEEEEEEEEEGVLRLLLVLVREDLSAVFNEASRLRSGSSERPMLKWCPKILL